MEDMLLQRVQETILKARQTVERARLVARYGSDAVSCAWCRRVCVDGRWAEAPWPLTPSQRRYVSHGMCDDCLAAQIATILDRKERECQS